MNIKTTKKLIIAIVFILAIIILGNVNRVNATYDYELAEDETEEWHVVCKLKIKDNYEINDKDFYMEMEDNNIVKVNISEFTKNGFDIKIEGKSKGETIGKLMSNKEEIDTKRVSKFKFKVTGKQSEKYYYYLNKNELQCKNNKEINGKIFYTTENGVTKEKLIEDLKTYYDESKYEIINFKSEKGKTETKIIGKTDMKEAPTYTIIWKEKSEEDKDNKNDGSIKKIFNSVLNFFTVGDDKPVKENKSVETGKETNLVDSIVNGAKNIFNGALELFKGKDNEIVDQAKKDKNGENAKGEAVTEIEGGKTYKYIFYEEDADDEKNNWDYRKKADLNEEVAGSLKKEDTFKVIWGSKDNNWIKIRKTGENEEYWLYKIDGTHGEFKERIEELTNIPVVKLEKDKTYIYITNTDTWSYRSSKDLKENVEGTLKLNDKFKVIDVDTANKWIEIQLIDKNDNENKSYFLYISDSSLGKFDLYIELEDDVKEKGEKNFLKNAMTGMVDGVKNLVTDDIGNTPLQTLTGVILFTKLFTNLKPGN